VDECAPCQERFQHIAADSRAVSALLSPVQRDHHAPPAPKPTPQEAGWTDAKKEKGYKWNVDAQDVGEIHRIPLEGLTVGFQDAAKSSLTKESAGGKAIVLVPKSTSTALQGPDAKLEVIIFLHGFTEDSETRPFGGYRALDLDKSPKKAPEDDAAPLRKGIDSTDVMPVRDVALDDAEGQLQDSGNPLTIMVLPQGGLRSEFGSAGGREFNADAYVKEIMSRVVNKRDWLATNRKPEEIVRRVTMAGHSGAGMALAEMARVSTRNDPERKKAAEAHKDYKPAPSAGSELTGDLVLFDAIKWDDLSAFEEWAKMRLDDDLTALQDIKTEPAAQREADRREYLVKKSQKLRGYYSTGSAYGAKYKALQTYIDQWFREHEAELAPLGVAGCLHANFSVMNPVSGSHEELMRGTKAGQSRVKEAGKPRENAGSILAAIEALHPDYTTCPPMGDLLTKPEEIKPKAKAKPEGAVEEEKKPATVGPAPAVSRIVDENLRVQRSQTEDLDKGFKAGGKGEVFNLLRQWGSSGPITPEKGLAACLNRLFGPDGSSATETDDRWLADKIIAGGSEPHWPVDAFKERATRAHDHKWAAEAGNIEGSFEAGKGKTSVEAFFFPGTSDRRAMIIGGVHGSEGSGVEVVNDLLAGMRKPDAVPPYYSVIIVPVVFPENLKLGFRTTGDKGDDPNRNFPAVGKTLDQAKDKKHVPRDSQGRRIEPENVILIDLIERFQPERIASVHGHSEPPPTPVVGKDMPGIFDDPRAGADEKKADDALALEMAEAASKKGVRVPGNWLGDKKNETSEYPPGAPKMSKGVSLGDYGPKKTDARPAITVVTVEVFGYATSEKSEDGAARKKELESLDTVLRDIFLGPPTSPAKQQP